MNTKTTVLAAALAASGALALLLVASAAPPSAEAKSWRERQQASAKAVRQPRRKGLFWRLDPKLYHWQPRGHFGVGPGSYECFGYDCNW